MRKILVFMFLLLITLQSVCFAKWIDPTPEQGASYWETIQHEKDLGYIQTYKCSKEYYPTLGFFGLSASASLPAASSFSNLNDWIHPLSEIGFRIALIDNTGTPPAKVIASSPGDTAGYFAPLFIMHYNNSKYLSSRDNPEKADVTLHIAFNNGIEKSWKLSPYMHINENEGLSVFYSLPKDFIESLENGTQVSLSTFSYTDNNYHTLLFPNEKTPSLKLLYSLFDFSLYKPVH